MQKRRKQTRFKELASVFEKLERTGSSNAVVNTLAEFLPKLSPEEIKITAYLLRGEVGPSFEALEFNLAQNMVIRALTQAYQLPEQKIKRALFKFGDLGIVAENLSKQKGDHLTITEVFNSLQQITRTSGKGSQKLKLDRLVELLSHVSDQEAKYIVRAILGTHRIGVADMTFLSGLAQGFTGKRENKAVLESVYNVMSDLGKVAFRLADKGFDALKQVSPVPGIPIRMMLASRVADLEEVSSHIIGSMFVEYKYDGERVQIHKDKRGGITAYSRRLENITNQYPEIIEQARKSLSAKEAIVEGEVVAIDSRTKKLQTFQVLMQRKRKHEIERYRKEVPIALFLFDLLYINGKSLLQLPLASRKKLLTQSIKESKNINIGKFIKTEEIAEVRAYFHKALAAGSEGVIIKAAKSPYQAGKRGWYWIKFKKEYQTELADTFDVVIIGALHGRGRRAGSFGSVLVACYDPETSKYYSFTKVGAGLTDAVLKSLPKILKPYVISKKHRQVETNMEADIWFEPVKVVEISGAQLTVSPVHTVARDKLKKGGLALRFPKFLRFREDKSAEQATTVQEIWDMYKSKVRS